MSAHTQTKGFLMSASTIAAMSAAAQVGHCPRGARVLAALSFRVVWGYALVRKGCPAARCGPALHDTSPLRQRLAAATLLRLRAGSALAKELGSVRAFVVFSATLGSTCMDYRPGIIIRHGC